MGERETHMDLLFIFAFIGYTCMCPDGMEPATLANRDDVPTSQATQPGLKKHFEMKTSEAKNMDFPEMIFVDRSQRDFSVSPQWLS